MYSKEISHLIISTAEFLGAGFAGDEFEPDRFEDELQKLNQQLKRMSQTCSSLECKVGERRDRLEARLKKV